MVERRSAMDAVRLTPKMEDFIRGGGSTPIPSLPPSEEVAVEILQADSPENKVRRGRPAKGVEVVRETQAAPDKSTALLDDILVPVTTKLRRKTVKALKRAYLEQKLQDRTPATQQEIMEEAVYEWLKRNGFRNG